ncbi:MAG: glyoxalase/bleomycin resistance protein/dioxygenase [Enterovirga sp.]|nr:glyoxalase/bleomycin resistance protein/dioxygenase [Enterovirga sp.]
MNWFIHHINIPAHDLEKSTVFYRDILGLNQAHPTYGTGSTNTRTGPEWISSFGDGYHGLHVTRPIPEFARDNNLSINPVANGHIAICVEDIDSVKKRLDEAGMMYADAGEYSIPGLLQIYVFDPSMNVIEINQEIRKGDDGSPARAD